MIVEDAYPAEREAARVSFLFSFLAYSGTLKGERVPRRRG